MLVVSSTKRLLVTLHDPPHDHHSSATIAPATSPMDDNGFFSISNFRVEPCEADVQATHCVSFTIHLVMRIRLPENQSGRFAAGSSYAFACYHPGMKGNKFQIWKDGKPLDEYSYEPLGQASLEWVQDTHGKEVGEVDVEGKYVRSVPELECHEAILAMSHYR